MTLSELEHSAMSPICFTTLLKQTRKSSNNRNTILPCVSRRLPYQSPAIFDPPSDVSNIYLVPGGRFLLTSGTEPHPTISLWDVGYNARAPINLLPVASLVLEHAVTEFEVQATGDGLGLRVFVISTTPPSTLLKVIEIYPSSPSASFSPIASCSLPRPLDCYSLNNDRVAYFDHRKIFVLDFISNTTVAWDVLFDSVFIRVCDES
jgi:hypothetical protein